MDWDHDIGALACRIVLEANSNAVPRRPRDGRERAGPDGAGALELYGPAPGADGGGAGARTGLVAFNARGVHSSDLAFFLDQDGVAIRAGHHCAQPLHAELGVSHSARASVHCYTTRADVDAFVERLGATLDFFGDVGGGEEAAASPGGAEQLDA